MTRSSYFLQIPVWKCHYAQHRRLFQLFYWMTLKLKLRPCFIMLLYKTFTALSNELPLNNMHGACDPGAAFHFSLVSVQQYFQIATPFYPLVVFIQLYTLILTVSPPLTSYFLSPPPSSPFPLSAFSMAATLRLPVPSLLAFCISSSWLPSPGCVWRVCSSISCWWRSLRVSTHTGGGHVCSHRLQEL